MAMRGAEAHARRLKKLRGTAVVRAMTAVVFGAAQDIAIDAARSVTTGATSGKNHVASLPGEAPNADTHVLDRSINAVVTEPLKSEVQVDAPYAVRLEFGDDVIEERPFLRPATARGRPAAVQKIRDALAYVVARSGS